MDDYVMQGCLAFLAFYLFHLATRARNRRRVIAKYGSVDNLKAKIARLKSKS